MNNLNQFTENLANKLLRVGDLTPLEIFFLKIYSGDTIYSPKMVKSSELTGTKIQNYYLQIEKKEANSWQSNYGIIAGAWIPQGHLSHLGTHPVVGFKFGGKYKRLLLDGTFAIKFINSPNEYTVVEDGIIYKTKHFFGGYIGLDVGFEFLRFEKNNFALIGGIAYDGFDTSGGDENDEDTTSGIGSLNLNIGLGYEFELKTGSRLGVETKYNFLNFKNPGGTDLSGDVISVNFIYRFADFGRNYDYYQF